MATVLKNIHGLKIISSDPKKSMEKSTEIFFFSFRKHTNENNFRGTNDAMKSERLSGLTNNTVLHLRSKIQISDKSPPKH